MQNPLQRGFTPNASPLMCATIIEAVLREAGDLKEITYCAYLDAKAAFDVVNHGSLMRKLYIHGVEGKAWNVIRDLHTNTTSNIKWEGRVSECFNVSQGVRQGGLLSTDLYKVYINDLLDRMECSGLGAKIGDIDCVSPTCADDVTILAKDSHAMQTLLNMAVEYSNNERYTLQPAKSAVLIARPSRRQHPISEHFTIGEIPISTQESVTHLGMIRHVISTVTATIDNNIQKACRRMYSLMKPGLHGENGLDPVTSLHLLTVYVLPILLHVYGFKVCLPKGNNLNRLEIFLKKILKQLLSLPITTPDAAVYILTGILPVEALIHKKTLAHFGAITRLPKTSKERNMATRQLQMKPRKSQSWSIELRKITEKYDLPDPLEILDNPPSSYRWKILPLLVRNKVNQYWGSRILLKAHAGP